MEASPSQTRLINRPPKRTADVANWTLTGCFIVIGWANVKGRAPAGLDLVISSLSVCLCQLNAKRKEERPTGSVILNAWTAVSVEAKSTRSSAGDGNSCIFSSLLLFLLFLLLCLSDASKQVKQLAQILSVGFSVCASSRLAHCCFH